MSKTNRCWLIVACTVGAASSLAQHNPVSFVIAIILGVVAAIHLEKLVS